VVLKVATGKLDFSANNIVCHFQEDGGRTITCTIARQALLDLGGYYGLKLSEVALFSVLLPEIERIASDKFHAGCIDGAGELSLEAADLVRFGFGEEKFHLPKKARDTMPQ
jgi:hypothetical protein